MNDYEQRPENVQDVKAIYTYLENVLLRWRVSLLRRNLGPANRLRRRLVACGLFVKKEKYFYSNSNSNSNRQIKFSSVCFGPHTKLYE